MAAIGYDELPEGTTFTGTIADVRVGDYVKASVHGYSLVVARTDYSLTYASGSSESGYPYGRPIHRPTVSEEQEEQARHARAGEAVTQREATAELYGPTVAPGSTAYQLGELQCIIIRLRPEMTGREVASLARELASEGWSVTR